MGSFTEGAAAGAGASSSLSDDESRNNSAKRFFAAEGDSAPTPAAASRACNRVAAVQFVKGDGGVVGDASNMRCKAAVAVAARSWKLGGVGGNGSVSVPSPSGLRGGVAAVTGVLGLIGVRREQLF